MDILAIIEALNEEEATYGVTSDLSADLRVENAGWHLAEEEGWIADETTTSYTPADLLEFVTSDGQVVAWNDQTNEWRWEGSVASRLIGEIKLRAEVTGRGEGSTVPTNEDAVDADVYVDGEVIGQVTLLPHEQTGELAAWGAPSNWASTELLAWMEARGGVSDWDDAIIGAVREVA